MWRRLLSAYQAAGRRQQRRQRIVLRQFSAARQCARTLADGSAGADACSADVVHLARLPDGWNRKRQNVWRVRLAQEVGLTQSVEELRARSLCD